MDLQNKKVGYVGGFGGIGFACCKELISRGVHDLVILDLKEEAEKLLELRSLNLDSSINFVSLNLCDGRDAIEAALQETSKILKTIDILINGAGIFNDRKPKLTVDINLMGPIEATLAAFSLMGRPQGKGGLIVNVASVLAFEPCPVSAIYTATKHGIMGFTRSCANKYYNEKTGISLMVICPGATMTPLIKTYAGMDTFEIARPISEKLHSEQLLQTAEECAKPMVDAIEKGINDSVWIVDLGKLKQVEMHKYWEYALNKE